MGNSDIREFAYIEPLNVKELTNTTVAVDAPNWLYKYMTTTARYTDEDAYTRDDGEELTNLIGALRGIKKFLNNNITPVFVFDGSPHNLKTEEIKRRKKHRKQAQENANNAENIIERSKYKSRSQHLNNTILQTTKKLFDLLNISYITAQKSAEAQCSEMVNKHEKISYVISDDYDALIFGAKNTIRQFTSSNKEKEVMKFKETLEKHDITHDQLIFATILCGTDYNDGVSGVGPKTAIKNVKQKQTISEIKQSYPSLTDNAEEIFNIYKNPAVKQTQVNIKNIQMQDKKKLKSFLKKNGIQLNEVEKTIQTIYEKSNQTSFHNFM